MAEPYQTHASLAVRITPTVERDEYLDYMTFKSSGPPLFTELFGPLIGLKEEWEQQGASAEELDLSAFRYRSPKRAAVAVNTGWMGGQEPGIVEETAEYVISRDRMGRRLKLSKGKATIPLPLGYPVKNMDDWLQVKPRYEFSEERFTEGWLEMARQARESGASLSVSIPGGFDEPRQLMGEEGVCIAYYEQPELIHDILDTIGTTAEKVLDRVSSAVQIDELFVHEDMAGKSGPLAGPSQVREFIKPYYLQVWQMLSSRGARLFGQDSDGDMNAVIPAFLESGVNVMFPMEPAANMDIAKIRQQFGSRLAFWGGIDKHVLRRSEDEITAELEYKIPPMIHSGGCLIALDHRIPNGTPIENYRFYINKAWEIIEREYQAVS